VTLAGSQKVGGGEHARAAAAVTGHSSLYRAYTAHSLISSYQPADGPLMEYGTAILYVIQEDWEVCSEHLLEINGAGPLLEAMMDSGSDDDSGELPRTRRAGC